MPLTNAFAEEYSLGDEAKYVTSAPEAMFLLIKCWEVSLEFHDTGVIVSSVVHHEIAQIWTNFVLVDDGSDAVRHILARVRAHRRGRPSKAVVRWP